MKKRFPTSVLFCLTALFMTLIYAGPSLAQNPTHLKWREYSTDHYTVFYPEGQEYTAYNAIDIAEKVHQPLVDMYGEPDGVISIVITDEEDFANGGAYFYNNKIVISATPLDFEFRSYHDWLWNVVTHELTHIFSIKESMKAPRWLPMAYYQHIDYQEEKREDVLVGYPNQIASYAIPMFNVPMWLSEGVAQYNARGAQYDHWDAHRDMILRQAVLNDKMLDIDDMARFTGTGREYEMVYDHGYALVLYIAERYGDEKLADLMRELSKASSFNIDIAIKKTFGISKNTLYSDWKQHLLEKYTSVRTSLGKLNEGKRFRIGGYLNGSPRWSPDGSRLAYVSNLGMDYGLTYCRVINFDPDGWQWKNKDKNVTKHNKKLEKELAEIDDPEKRAEAEIMSASAFDITAGVGAQTTPVWLDNWSVLYNRYSTADRRGSHWWDIYRYTINREDPREGTEKRISDSLRGTYPDLSPDGSMLAFVKNDSGQNNLYIMRRDDNSLTQLTKFTDGTHIYQPRWSPDGSRIAFTLHRGSEVNIGVVDKNGLNLKCLVSSNGQDRDAAWNSDGTSIVFSSDISGIPNLYRVNLASGDVSRLTNVIGAAFQPDVSPADSTIAYSYYGADGYELRLLTDTAGIPETNSSRFHQKANLVQNLDKPVYPVADSKPYRMKTLDFSFMPLVRNDQGNVKIGSFITKNEVVDFGNFIFSGAWSPTTHETDLYARFEYKKLLPTAFIEMYRITRSVGKNENFMEEYGTITRKRMYNLNEIDFGLSYDYKNKHQFEGRLIYSQYNAKVEYTHFLTGPKIHKPDYTYSKGFDMSLTYDFDTHTRARDEEINPRGGRKIEARYDYNVNFFLDKFEYVGFLKEKYKRYPYNRYYLKWRERLPVPGTKKHTFVLGGMANIIDRQIDNFYENQLGGPSQMRGYTFYSMTGRKNLMASATYRFPLLYDVRKHFFIWDINHVYMGFFTDIGKAWNKRSLNWSTKAFKHDYGAELRIDSSSFYNFPTMIQFSAAYGPDDTWIRQFDNETSREYWKKDDQEPWKFYLQVLFGFN